MSPDEFPSIMSQWLALVLKRDNGAERERPNLEPKSPWFSVWLVPRVATSPQTINQTPAEATRCDDLRNVRLGAWGGSNDWTRFAISSCTETSSRLTSRSALPRCRSSMTRPSSSRLGFTIPDSHSLPQLRIQSPGGPNSVDQNRSSFARRICLLRSGQILAGIDRSEWKCLGHRAFPDLLSRTL